MKDLVSGFGLGSSELFVLRPHSVNTDFLQYWMRNDLFIQQGCSTMTGTGGLKRVSPLFMQNSNVVIPSHNEQEEIVDFLNHKVGCIDEIIAKSLNLIKEIESFKKSIIFEYVTGKKEVV